MELKKASLETIRALHDICTEAYAKNFHHHWNSDGLDWYLEKEFSQKRLTVDLMSPQIDYFFIHLNDKPVGFVKLNNHSNLPGMLPEEGSELEKIYILPEAKGNGIGKLVLEQLIRQVKGLGKKNFFLCVIDTNLPAIAFYEKMGFVFHSKTRLDIPYFKEELKGMNRMVLAFASS